MMVRGGERVCVWRNVWRTVTGLLSPLGQLVHMYTELPLQCHVSAVAYHPHEHTAAFTAFGPHQPLVLVTVDPVATPSLTQPCRTHQTNTPIS